jgi:hypothetical protein
VIVPGLITLAVRLWLHHRPGVDADTRMRYVTIAVAATLAVMAAIEFTVMPQQVLPNVAARFTSSPFDRLLLVIYAIAALAIVRVAAPLWQLPYRVTFEIGREFWRALHSSAVASWSAEATPPLSNHAIGKAGGVASALHVLLVQPVLHVWSALQSPAVRPTFTIWAAARSRFSCSRDSRRSMRQIVAPF